MSSPFANALMYIPATAAHASPIYNPSPPNSVAAVNCQYISVIPGPSIISPYATQPNFTLPSPAPYFPGAVHPASSAFLDEEVRAAEWKRLTAKMDKTRLRRHTWGYQKKHANPIPAYQFCSLTKIADIWTEWSSGIDGYLPVRQLEEEWGPKWRPERGQGTEKSRRMNVVKLVERLAKKTGWNHAMALRFLGEKYDSHFTPRKFMDRVQENGGAFAEQVFLDSCYYCS